MFSNLCCVLFIYRLIYFYLLRYNGYSYLHTTILHYPRNKSILLVLTFLIFSSKLHHFRSLNIIYLENIVAIEVDQVIRKTKRIRPDNYHKKYYTGILLRFSFYRYY